MKVPKVLHCPIFPYMEDDWVFVKLNGAVRSLVKLIFLQMYEFVEEWLEFVSPLKTILWFKRVSLFLN